MPVGEITQLAIAEGVSTTPATPTPIASATGATLADGKILVGNGSNVAAEVTPSGAVSMTNAGVFSIVSDYITNAMVNASAAIAYAKLALTNSIVNADIASAAAIAYSKLNLSGGIVNADINASAAIAGSKLQAASNSNAGTINYYHATTFTPTIFANGANFSSVTYSLQSGTYTRIGRVVTFALRIIWTNATGSPTGALGVGNFPHAAAADTYMTVLIDNVDTPTGCIGMSGTMASGSTSVLLASSRDAASFVNIDSAVNSGSATRQIYMAGSYQV